MAKLRYAFADESFGIFRSHHIKVRPAKSSWEKQQYFALRRRVFSSEQKIMPGDDHDGDDFRSIPLIALAANCGISSDVIGAVRIFHDGEDAAGRAIWYGGRLCVERGYRGFFPVGKALINEAVSRAKDAGCECFLANVQPQNERYFRSLHWSSLGEVAVAGRSHICMQADLAAYPLMPRCQQ